MTEALSRVAFFARSESRYFQLALARMLKEGYGSTLHLYCSGRQDIDFYTAQNRDGLFSSISDSAILLKNRDTVRLDAEAVTARARAVEDRIGLTINQLSVANRHLGRGYALGGFYHPRSRQSENTTYHQMLHAYSEMIEFLEKEFQEKRISLVLNGGKESAVTARALGIPFRTMASSRYASYHLWAWNEFYENPRIQEIYYSNDDLPDASLIKPYDSHRLARGGYMKSFGVVPMARRLGYHALRHVYWHLRGYEAAKNYYLRELLRLSWRRWTEYRRLRALAKTTLSDLDGQPFVFFPLHVEPEAALQIISPEYIYQLSAIAALSRDLPAGTVLAVKEAYGAIGRRPDNFYDQIAEFKNVVLLDTWQIGLECVRQAAAVGTICGSAGFEGAVLGKPVVAFGHHNSYNFLPHVYKVTDETKLAGRLHDMLNGCSPSETASQDGRRFLRAVVAASFDMRGYDYINLHDFSQDAVADCCDSLAQSVAFADTPSKQSLAV